MRHIAIVLAAGRGKRMNSKVAKQYLLIKEKPVLYYALKQFEDSFVDGIILVTGEEDIAYCKENIVKKYGFTKSCSIISFEREALELVREKNKEIKIFKLVSKLTDDEMQKCIDAENMGVSFNGNQKSNTPEKIDELKKNGIELACWTVDTPETMLKWVNEGITTFVTNRIYYHN